MNNVWGTSDDVPLRDPVDRDYMFVANQILPRDEIEEKLLRMQQLPTSTNIKECTRVIFRPGIKLSASDILFRKFRTKLKRSELEDDY